MWLSLAIWKIQQLFHFLCVNNFASQFCCVVHRWRWGSKDYFVCLKMQSILDLAWETVGMTGRLGVTLASVAFLTMQSDNEGYPQGDWLLTGGLFSLTLCT